MGKVMQYMIHCTDTPPWVKVNRTVLYRWHLGPKKHKDGSVTYLGIKYPSMKEAPLSPIHKNFVGRGWSKYGYSKLFWRNGRVEELVKHNNDGYISYDEMTWGCAGQNAVTYHVALVGGKLQNNQSPPKGLTFDKLFTDPQFDSLQRDVKQFLFKYPHARVCGHYQYDRRKKCPNFDVTELAKSYQIEEYLL